jgi:vacuolar fusion protein MON1
MCPDIHILLNTVHSPSIANSPASSSWIPICLPKFNPSSFVNAYISFLHKDDVDEVQAGGSTPNAEDATDSRSPSISSHNMKSSQPSSDRRKVTLLCISGGGDLDAIRAWCATVTQVQSVRPSINMESDHAFEQRLEKDGTLASIADACSSESTEYSVSDLGIPGLRHFVYKSRSQVQITVPIFEDPYDNMEDRRR